MTDLTTSLILNLKNAQFTRGLQHSSRAVGSFTNKSERELRGLRQEFKQLTGGALSNFRNEIVAIGAAWSGLQIAKDSALLDKNLTRMSQTAGVARSETKALRAELYDLQKQYGVTVDSSRQANDSLLQSGLNWKESLQATKAIAPAQVVTSANSNVLASGLAVGAEIFGFDLSQVGVATEMLDKMTVAGREGNAELEDLSSIFSRVGNNAKTANLDFSQTLGFIEQLSKIEKQPERLATLADSTLRIFTNQKYQNKVRDNLGINFYGKDGNRRDTFSVIEEISTLFKKQKNDKQRDNLIAAAFGETDMDTQRGMKALLGGDAVEGMRQITENTRNGVGVIKRDLKDALDNSVDQVSRLKGALGQAGDEFAQPINSSINKLIKYALDSKEQGGKELDGFDLLLGGSSALLAGGLAAKYGSKAIRGSLGKGSAVAGGVVAGKALEELAGVTPVYVVNMPNGAVPGFQPGFNMPGSLPGKGPLSHTTVAKAKAAAGLIGGTKLSKLGYLGAGAVGTAGAAVTSAGAVGYGVGSLINEAFELSDEHLDTRIQSALADTLGKGIAHILAGFGNEEAKSAIAANASLKIEVEDKRVNIKSLNAQGMDADVHGGYSMAMP